MCYQSPRHRHHERSRSAAGLLFRASIVALGALLLVACPVRAGVLDATWNAPTTNPGGGPLTNLASYRVYYGTSASPDRKSTRLNSSHLVISYAVFCLKKKKTTISLDDNIPSHRPRHHTLSLYAPILKSPHLRSTT